VGFIDFGIYLMLLVMKLFGILVAGDFGSPESSRVNGYDCICSAVRYADTSYVQISLGDTMRISSQATLSASPKHLRASKTVSWRSSVYRVNLGGPGDKSARSVRK
jgi:hypothetical protein